jgi:long-chain fatty acid transport protein
MTAAKRSTNCSKASPTLITSLGRFATPALLPGLALLACFPAGAEGFRNPTIGTFGLGRSGGRIAQVNDATAVQHNPANLTDLSEAQLAYEQGLVYAKTDYTAMDGQTTETEDPWKFLPAAFANLPLGERWAAGLGVTLPYGLSTEWDPNGYFRYQAPHFAQLITVNINPSLAWKITDNLSIGAGLDVMWSQLTLKQYYPWGLAIPLAPDAQLQAEGTGTGVSGNVGITWEFAKGQRLAATCRAPMNIDYDGSFDISYVPPPLAGLVPTSSSFASEAKFPTIVSAGYGIQVSERVRLEIDGEWLQFSRFQSLPFTVGAQLPGIPTSVPENWRNTFTIGAGGDWALSQHWTLRFGYQYFQTPVPDSTFSPTIPDANQNVFTVGIAWQSGHHQLAASYGGILYADREIRDDVNPAYNGDYDITVHLISASYHFTF